MSSSPRGVLIDLDDTLYLETDYARSGYRAVSAHFDQGDAGASRLWDIFAAGERRNVLGRWLGEIGESARLMEAVEFYRTHVPELTPIAGWIALLGQWRAAGYRLGVVTDGPARQQGAKAIGVGIGQLVDAVVLSDELGGRDAWKPNPLPYRTCLERLGVEPSAALYVGDNPTKDFLGARNAGMRSIRLRWPGGLHAAMEPLDAAHAPDLDVADLAGVAVGVESLLGGSR